MSSKKNLQKLLKTLQGKKKKKPTKKQVKKKAKRELEGYYIPGDGTIKVIYRKNGGISI